MVYGRALWFGQINMVGSILASAELPIIAKNLDLYVILVQEQHCIVLKLSQSRVRTSASMFIVDWTLRAVCSIDGHLAHLECVLDLLEIIIGVNYNANSPF
ncbi:hypothetical protein EVAR_5205_1 [Eumeta japonica]|uniref:Uncharacterized protein n=1 Tax=Eumeta variegata TaxID=151549 RepID=A0A4C1V393_EUMVA|nr:hypothetical protein EVAR_5205_1 [Eumeta japonica]